MKPSTPYGRARASSFLRSVNRGSAHELAADNFELVAIAVITLAAVIVLRFLTRPHGLGLTPDSAAYISAADHLLHGRWLTQHDGRPLVLWPPLYPALLAVFSLVFSPMTAAKVINGICLAGTTLAGWWWMRRVFGRAAGVSAAAGLAFSSVLLMACMAWTEPLFLLFTVAGMATLDRFRSTGHGLTRAALLAAAAALTRYPGVALIATGALLVLAGPGRERPVRDAAAYLLVSFTPLGLWLCRNWVVTQTLTGPRYPATVGLKGALAQVGVAVAGWLPGPHLPMFILIAAAVLAGTVVILFAMQAEKSRFVQAALLFTVIYAAQLVLSSAFVAMDHINLRLIAPLFPAALMLAAGGLFCLPRVWPARLTRGLMAAGLVLLPLVVGLRTASLGYETLTYGPGGYTLPVWRNSELLAWVRDNPLPQPVYANEPGVVYLLGGRRPAIASPAFNPYHSPDGPADDPGQLVATGGSLVLFDQAEPRYMKREELQKVMGLEVVREFEDGVIYRIRPLAPPEPEPPLDADMLLDGDTVAE